MRTNPLSRLTLLLLALLLVLAACNRADDTAVTDDRTTEVDLATDEPATDESATAEPTPVEIATAVPTPVATPIPDRNLTYDWAPQIVYSSPQPGEPALLNGAITVRFDQPMDQGAVEAAFAVARADDDQTVSGSFDWPRPDTVVFTPQSQLARQQNYRVTIGDGAKAETGLTLASPVDLQLQTVGYLSVSQVIPAADTDDVAVDAAITVLFNRPVVPLVSIGDQAGLPQPLTFDPPVSGQGEWVSSSIYRFQPDGVLDGGTTYQVTIAAGLADVNGGVLEDDFGWNFATQLPEVSTVLPENAIRGVDPTQPITVTFNAPMDRAATAAAVSFDPAVSFTTEWQDNDRTLVIVPDAMLALDTQYELTVANSASSAGNGAQMQRPFTSIFTTVRNPAVIGTLPQNDRVADRWQYGFTIRFASPMNWDMVEELLQISPAPRRVDYYANSYDNTNELSANFELTPNQSYSVVLPGTAEDALGNPLGDDFSFSFTAADYQPIASLNLPQVVSQVSNAFPTDVGLLVRNVDNVTVRLYDAGLPLSLLREPYQINENPPLSEPLREWQLSPTVTGDSFGLETISLADGAALPTGVYQLWVNAPGVDEYARYWQVQRHLLIVADTNIVVKEMIGETHVWLTDLETGEPAANRSVRGFSNDGGTSLGTAVTDANGFATLTHNSLQDWLPGVTVISGEPGEAGFGVGNSGWSGEIRPWNMGLFADYSKEQPIFSYIYTDRPIYRPGDTVYFKGIVRQPNYGRYSLPDRERVNVQLNGMFYIENGEPLNQTFDLALDDQGVFTGEFVLPDDVILGDYQLYIEGMQYDGYRGFTVAEYRKPEFQLTLTPDTPETVRGDSVEMTLNAAYFFGGTASDLYISYTVYETPFYPQVPGPNYNFGDNASYIWRDLGPFGFGGGGELGKYVVGGEDRTDANGNFSFTLPADLLDEADPGGRVVTVEAIVSDLAQFPVTARAEVTYHAGEVYVGINPQDYFSRSGQETAVDLITVDWDGSAIPNQDVEVVFYNREWEYDRSSQYSMYYSAWTPIDTEVARALVTTDANGEATASFTPEFAGNYMAVATVQDSAGREHFSSTYLWVSSQDFFGWRSDPKARTMELTLDQTSYAPGDTARMLVQSPFAQPVQAWLTIERGTLLEQRLITVNGSEIVEIPITAAHAPNVYMTVVAIKPVNTADGDFPYADMRVGIVEATVSTEQLGLNVAIQPDAEDYQPGDTAVYNITVTNYSGSPVQAELSVALVDLAVLTLKDDNAPDIVEGFYFRQPLRSQLGAGLLVSGEGLEPEVPLEGGGFGGGGGDGGVQSAALVDEDTARRNFPDTAYWEAQIETDANGTATVEIPLPDALTTWRLSSKAFTSDNRVGQSFRDVTTSLPLLLRPVTPRFFTVGDVMQIGTYVNNNTPDAIEATVTLEADGLLLPDVIEQTVTVAGNGRALVRWEVGVDDVVFADITFRVTGGGYSDATKPTFGVGPDQLVPVYRYNAEDMVGSAGELDGAGRRVEAILLPDNLDTRIGTAEVTLSPSLAAAVTQALASNTDLDFDAQCAAEYTHRLLPNLAVLDAIRALGLDEAKLESALLNVIPVQINAIEQLAKRGGGWGWCYSDRVDPWLTAYSLQALVQAQNAGFDVDEDVITRSRGYLLSRIQNPDRYTAAWKANEQAFFIYVLAEADSIVLEDLDALYNTHRDVMDPYAKAYLAMAYDLLDTTEDYHDQLLSDLDTAAVVSATGTHWEREEEYWNNLGTDVRDTAVVIEALSRMQPDSPLLVPAVRWLMVARTAAYWSTPMETAQSIQALTRYMVETGEFEADFGFELMVNAETAVAGDFNSTNILTNETLSVPLAELVAGEANFFAFERDGGNGRLYYTLHLNSFIDANSVNAVDRGFAVSRVYYDAACDLETEDCQPITEIAAGQQVRVVVTVILPEDRIYVRVEDPIPAGAEAVNPGLETNQAGAGGTIEQVEASYRYGYWGWWSFDHIQYKDEKVVFSSQSLPAGTYQYSYLLQTNMPGTYQVMPTTAREDFFPEVFGRSDGMVFTISE